jgi:AcrR family transcriptional regulator
MCNDLRAMTRKYELKARAERQEQTRLRIVDAAIELHATKGPARTTVSDIARVAGVQRHTVYRHFPDERSLGLACSGLYAERNPPPDPEPWRSLPGEERLRRALGELYAFYERNEEMFTRIARDAEFDELTRELFQLRFGPFAAAARDVLGGAVSRRRQAHAALDLALELHTWQRLRASGLTSEEAAETMARALRCL